MATPRIVLFTAGHTERNGGLARHSRLLVEGFAEDGWRVRAISRSGSLRRPRLVRGPGFTVLEVPGFDNPRLGAALYLAIAVPLGAWWARGARGTLAVHLGSTTVAAGLVARLWGRPFVALSTTSGEWSEVTEALRCAPTSLRRRVLRAATALVAQSAATAPELVPLTTPERVAVVPNPLRLPAPAPLDGRPRALVLGRLASEKGSFTIVRAWRRVVAAHPDARLSFVGIGGTWRSIEDELRAELADDEALAESVELCGWSDDVPGDLADHDVFILASSTEGMSNSLLEACALGRVVVASDIPQNRVVLGDDHPLLFPVDDADALAELLLRAFSDEELRRKVSAGVVAAVQQNDVRVVVRRHAALLSAADEDRLPGGEVEA